MTKPLAKNHLPSPSQLFTKMFWLYHIHHTHLQSIKDLTRLLTLLC